MAKADKVLAKTKIVGVRLTPAVRAALDAFDELPSRLVARFVVERLVTEKRISASDAATALVRAPGSGWRKGVLGAHPKTPRRKGRGRTAAREPR